MTVRRIVEGTALRVLVIYGSAYGNTKVIAEAIAEGFNKPSKARTVLADQVPMATLADYDLIIVGAPTQGGKPLPAVQLFLERLPAGILRGKKVAAFDTRYAIGEHGIGLKLVMKTIGFAASKIARTLVVRGGQLIADPEGFIVSGKEGPLRDDEAGRAKHWAEKLAKPFN